MARVLVFAWEVGAAAVLSPLIPLLYEHGHRCEVVGIGPALGCFHDRCPADVAVSDTLSEEMLMKADVCLAGYGNPARKEALSVWERIARRMPAMVVLDQWKGVDRFFDMEGRYRQPSPKRLAVVSSVVAEELARRGVPDTDVTVVGHPVLQRCIQGDFLAGVASKDELRDRLGISRKHKVYVLASEGVHDGHMGWQPCSAECRKLFFCESEGRPLWRVLVDRDGGTNVTFVFRPHPRENAPVGSCVKSVSWEQADDRSLLAVADKVYGISSMLFLQAAALGIQTVNVMNMVPGWKPESAFLPEVVWHAMAGSGMLDHCKAPEEAKQSHADVAQKIVSELESLMVS